MRISRLGRAVLAAGLAASVVGCTATPPSPSSPPTASRTAPRTASPSATPAAHAEPLAQIPATCGRLIGDAEADAAAGADVTLQPDYASALYALETATTRQSGVLTCRWLATSASGSLVMTVWRHAQLRIDNPAGEVPFFAEGAPADVGADRSALSCSGSCGIDARVGDYILRATTSDAAHRTQLVQAVRSAVATLKAGGEPEAWRAPEGAWPTELDCARIESDGRVAEGLRSPSLRVTDSTGASPADTGEPAVLGHLGGVTSCSWEQQAAPPAGEVAGIYLTTVSGGGWAVHRILSGGAYTAAPLDVAGADEAGTVCDAQLRCAVVARIGVDALSYSDPQSVFDDFIPADRLAAAAPAVVAGVVAAGRR